MDQEGWERFLCAPVKAAARALPQPDGGNTRGLVIRAQPDSVLFVNHSFTECFLWKGYPSSSRDSESVTGALVCLCMHAYISISVSEYIYTTSVCFHFFVFANACMSFCVCVRCMCALVRTAPLSSHHLLCIPTGTLYLIRNL